MKHLLKACSLIVAMIMLLLVISCDEKDDTNYEELKINKFLQERAITTEPTASGLYYIELEPGTGFAPRLGDTAVVNYKGMFLDGRVFDYQLGTDTYEVVIGVSGVIAGWHEGLSYMQPGAKAWLLIPSKLAYGPAGRGSIPGSTPLLFEINMINVKPGTPLEK